jgi:hypothetical protein
MRTLSRRFGHDMSKYPLDGPVPDLPLSNLMHSYNKVASSKAKRLGLKLRDIYNEIAVARGYPVACGSPATVADFMEEWFRDGAVDGFMLLPAHFPEAFDDFIDLVIPELQRRGVFRKDYQARCCATISACPSRRTDSLARLKQDRMSLQLLVGQPFANGQRLRVL